MTRINLQGVIPAICEADSNSGDPVKRAAKLRTQSWIPDLRSARLRLSGMTAIVILLFSFPSQAAGFSGAYMWEICKSDAQGKEVVKGGHTACQAYIAGVVDHQKLLRSLGTTLSADFCLPDDVGMKRLQDVVWTYLDTHSENDAFIAAPAVAVALSEIYPCQ